VTSTGEDAVTAMRRNFGIRLAGDTALHPRKMNSSTTPLRPLKMHKCILRVQVFLLSHLISRLFSSQNFIVPPNFIRPLCLVLLLSHHCSSSVLLFPPHIDHSLFSPPTFPLFLTTMFFALSSSHYSSPSTLFSSSLFLPELPSLL
jgi:hypothetical protein